MPKSTMHSSVPARTRGTVSATTEPVRKPRLRKLTSSTAAKASKKVRVNSPMAVLTTRD